MKRVFCLLLIATLLLPLTGCTQKNQEISWDLYGVWVTQDGASGEKTQLSLQGSYPLADVSAEPVEVDFDIVWPDSFRFVNGRGGFSIGYSVSIGTDGSLPALWCCGTAYDSALNKPCGVTALICPSEQFIVLECLDDRGSYFVASTNPDADPAEIMELCKEFFS